MKLFKRLFCKHNYEHLRNAFGDEINYCHCRSFYKCTKCGKIKKEQYLNFGGSI